MLNRSLLADISISEFGPIQIWDTTGTTGLPGGIILKLRRSSLLTSGGKDSVDIYYSSNGLELPLHPTLPIIGVLLFV